MDEEDPAFFSNDLTACIDDPDVLWAVREIKSVARRHRRGETYLEFWVNEVVFGTYFIQIETDNLLN